MAKQVGTAGIKFVADNTQLMRSLKRIERNVVKTARNTAKTARQNSKNAEKMAKDSAGAIGNTHKSVLKNLVALSGALLSLKVAFRDTIVASANFEYQLSKVGTMLSEQTRNFLPKYGNKLKSMSIEFGQSTKTLSEGLYDILSAQIEADKAMGFLATSSKAAIAGFSDTKTVSSALLSIIKAYGLSAKDAKKISDKLFMTVYKGRLTFNDLAESVGSVVSTAASAGLSIDDFLASFSTISRIVGKAKMTAASITGIMNAVLKPSKQGKEVLDKLGLSLDEATLKAKGFEFVLKKLANAKPTELSKVFPRIQAIRGFTAALKEIKGYGEDFEDISNSTGMVDKNLKNVIKTSKILKDRALQAFNAFKIAIGDALINDAKALLTIIIDITKTITKFISENRKLVRTLLVGAGVMGVTLSVLVGWKVILPLIANLGWKAAAGIGAIAAGGSGISLLSDDMTVLIKKLTVLGKVITTPFTLVYKLGNRVGNAFSNLIPIVKNVFPMIGNMVIKVAADILSKASDVFSKLKTYVSKFENWLAKIMSKAMLKILDFAQKIAPEWLSGLLNLDDLKANLKDIQSGKKKLFIESESKSIFAKWGSTMRDYFKEVSDISKSKAEENRLNIAVALKGSKDIFKKAVKDFTNDLKSSWKDLKTMFAGVDEDDFGYKEDIRGKKMKEGSGVLQNLYNRLKKPLSLIVNKIDKAARIAGSMKYNLKGYEKSMSNVSSEWSKVVKDSKKLKAFNPYDPKNYMKYQSKTTFGTNLPNYPKGKDKESKYQRDIADLSAMFKYNRSNIGFSGFDTKLDTTKIHAGDTEYIEKQKEQVEKVKYLWGGMLKFTKESLKEFKDYFSNSMEGTFRSVLEKGKNFSERWKTFTDGFWTSLYNSFVNYFAKRMAKSFTESFMDTIGLGNIFGGGSAAPTSDIGGGASFSMQRQPITQMATGGLLKKPSIVMAGEAGKERVLSASQTKAFEKMVDNNFNNKSSDTPNVSVNVTNNTKNNVNADNVSFEKVGKEFIVNVVMEEAQNNPGFTNMLRR